MKSNYFKSLIIFIPLLMFFICKRGFAQVKRKSAEVCKNKTSIEKDYQRLDGGEKLFMDIDVCPECNFTDHPSQNIDECDAIQVSTPPWQQGKGECVFSVTLPKDFSGAHNGLFKGAISCRFRGEKGKKPGVIKWEVKTEEPVCDQDASYNESCTKDETDGLNVVGVALDCAEEKARESCREQTDGACPWLGQEDIDIDIDIPEEIGDPREATVSVSGTCTNSKTRGNRNR